MSTTSILEPVQNRARKTQAQLLTAVERLAETEGCEAVTTTRIASLCGVAVGTIYRYYPDRNALLAAAYDATVSRIVAQCAEEMSAPLADGEPLQSIERLLDAYIGAAEAIPAHTLLLREMRRLDPGLTNRAGEAKIIGELIAPALAGLGVPAERITAGRLNILFAILSNLVDLYLMRDAPADRAEIRRELGAHASLAFQRMFQEKTPPQGGV
ncbi:TetR/AcrR family transcriptional regulator [Oricola sp.]|uniref:TetR/AcrR family transcriptional regulator n=1 Tax=Oricola sp. TaxID=1979950 RepID=UPI003BAC129B